MTEYKFATREEWLNGFVTYARPEFLARGYTLPDLIRVSMGFTSTGARGGALGECWSDTASADGHFEIFLRPKSDSDARIADVLTHELCHAAVGFVPGEPLHGKAFKACAASMGLVGRASATTAGEEWYRWALPILTELGPLPYGALNDGVSTAKPKQKAYLLKAECPVCQFVCRVTAKHVDAHSHLNCPVPDCVGVLVIEE